MQFRPGRRVRRNATRKTRRLVAVLLGSVACAAALLVACAPEGSDRDPVVARAAAHVAAVKVAEVPAAPGAARKVYPYSVIPGGVQSAAELAAQAKADPVVARHYTGFDLDKAHAATVARPRAVHVSYRKDGKVYWTSGTVMLAAGEAVFTDGSNEIRGRCGNRIADSLQMPVAANEPTAAQLDSLMADDGALQTVAYAPDADTPGPGVHLDNASFHTEQINASSSAARIMAAPPSLAQFNLPDSHAIASALSPRGFIVATAAVATAAPAPATPDSNAVPPTVVQPATPPQPADPPAAPAEPGADAPVAPVKPAVAPPAAPVKPASPATSPAPPASTPPAPDTKPPVPGIPEGMHPPIGSLPAQPTATPDAASIPEPGSLWLFGAAFAALLLHARRRRTRS